MYDVEYFAVCANGEVRPMECVDGYFDFSDTMGNYMGFKLKEEEKNNDINSIQRQEQNGKH